MMRLGRIFIAIVTAVLWMAQHGTGMIVHSAQASEAAKESKAPAASKKTAEEEGAGPIGYGGPRLRLSPLMVPIRTSGGVMYEPLVVQLALGGGDGEQGLPQAGDVKVKQACFSVPFIHEKFFFYVYGANLKSEDLHGERRALLESKLFDVVQNFMGKGYFTGVEIVHEETPPLEPKSATMSVQCR